MIPLGSFLNIEHSAGPARVMHYNGYVTAEINGAAAPGYSSDHAKAAIEDILAETLPLGMTYEWTEITYQQILAGNASAFSNVAVFRGRQGNQPGRRTLVSGETTRSVRRTPGQRHRSDEPLLLRIPLADAAGRD